MLTKKPAGRKLSSSLFSNLFRKSIVPEQTLKPQLLQDFLDSVGQFKRILKARKINGWILTKDNDFVAIVKKLKAPPKYLLSNTEMFLQVHLHEQL